MEARHRARSASSDFADVSHLVEPGRAKNQRRLSRVVVVAQLCQNGIKGWSAQPLPKLLADLSPLSDLSPLHPALRSLNWR